MGRNLPVWLLLALVTAGCAARPPLPAGPPPTWAFPPDAFITQRAVLTARGRQFVLNGYLSKSAHDGLRLLVTESFGQVLADLLVKTNGDVTVFRANQPLRPDWVRRYLASDLRSIFGRAIDPNCSLTMSAPDEFVISRRWYKLDLRVVSIQPGPQPADKFTAPPSANP